MLGRYSSRDTLGVVGIPMYFRENALEQKVCDFFQENDVDAYDRAYHCLQDKDQKNVKFTNRKYYLQILELRRQLIGLYPVAGDLPEETKIFINIEEYETLREKVDEKS